MLAQDFGEGADRGDAGQHRMAEFDQRRVLAQPVRQCGGGFRGFTIAAVQLQEGARQAGALPTKYSTASGSAVGRSEESRGGKECGSTGGCRWWPDHKTKKK